MNSVVGCLNPQGDSYSQRMAWVFLKWGFFEKWDIFLHIYRFFIIHRIIQVSFKGAWAVQVPVDDIFKFAHSAQGWQKVHASCRMI